VRFRLTRENPDEEGIRFKTLSGGRDGADYIVAAIQDAALRVRARPVEADDSVVPLEVSIPDRLPTYVGKRGGKLYVWTQPITDDIAKYRISTRSADGVTFAHYEDVVDFNLYVSEDFILDWRSRARPGPDRTAVGTQD
jgi:hypothetical protein